jgi:glyoxylase-like metal-dependent hydrolase (beta-lactamase superfamily II)
MTVELYAFTCGRLTLPMSALLEGMDGELTVPVPAYLVVHPNGRLLFDTGLNPLLHNDIQDYLGEAVARLIQFDFPEHEQIHHRLAQVGVEVGDIGLIVNSHLHLDHAGGNAQIPHAKVLVQRRELAAARRGDTMEYFSADFETGQEFIEVDGEHDVFGDGTVVCIPTYGHTAGHQSLQVQTSQGRYVICADACYLRRTINELHLPGPTADKASAMQSLHRLRELESTGSQLLLGHDPEEWASVPQAPAQLDLRS